jgi:hypothetical protein
MQYRLDYFNEKNNSISNVYRRTDPEFLNQPYGFRALLKDSRGNLLVGTEGLFLYTPSEKKPFGRIWRNIPGSRGVFCIKEDHEGTVWAGSSRKLIRLNHDYGVDSVFQISDIEYNVEDICFADSGKLWLALLGGGLELFDPQTGKREFYTTADGLSNNTTYSILEDRQKNLWISTDNGITRFNPFTHKFRIFGYTDGLRIHEFNSDAAFATSEGRMFFGGMGGVVAFHPDSIREDEARGNAAWLILTEFRVSGQPRYFNKAIYELKAVTLKKGDDNFGVSFACLDFKNADKIKYRYRLLGYDNAWTVISHLHRRINFAGLPPGKYALEVESTDINGSWTGRMALMITIPPFFYQTIGFMIVLGIFALGVIALFVMLNNRQIRMKEKQKQHHLKLESIRGQMNPHFIFNSLNSINYFIAKSDRLSANRYIANFSKLIRAFLINMSHEYVSLSDEIASLQDYLKLEFLRFGDKFDYLLNIEQVQETENWEVFPGMVQPFIENAIWHGVRGLQYRKGFITIRFILNPSGHLQCEVTDDGIGRKLAEQGKKVNGEKKSRGILLTLERMHIINHLEKRNYHILIQDLHPEKDECGTRVIIDIPSRKKISTHIFQNP